MDCLVTGGAGFIGSNIVHALVAKGKSVRVLDDLSTGRRENIRALEGKVELLEGSITDLATARAAVKGVKHVFHLAALPSVARSVEDPLTSNTVNVGGTLNMLVAARDAGVARLVFSSSSSVYGNTPVLPKREDMTPTPLSPYAVQKLTGEHYCRIFHGLYGLKTFVLRYFNVFGPRQNPHSQYAAVIPLFIDSLRKNTSPVIYGDGEQTRDFTFVEDVVSANLCCCEAPESAAGQVFNVAWGMRISVNQLAGKLTRILGSTARPEYRPARDGDVRDSQADSTRARQILSWQPAVSFDEGLKRTTEWFMR